MVRRSSPKRPSKNLTGKETVSMRATAGLLLVIVVLLVSGWISYRSIHRLAVNEAWVVHTYEVLDELNNILTTLTEAESAQRGFIITGQQTYTEPYRAALVALEVHFYRVKALTSDNPVQQQRLMILGPLFAARLGSLEGGMEAYAQRELNGARDYILSGTGKSEMGSIHSLIDAMNKSETDLLQARGDESRASYRAAVVTQWSTALLGLGLVVASYLLMTRELETRRRGVQALALANERLEIRVEERTADLGSANEALRRSNRELEQFASVASHDLQEPLRKIQAFGDRLQTKCAEGLGEQGRDYLSRMQASAGRMRSLIDALLTFSRVTTKAQPFAPVDLSLTAADVISDLEERVERSGGRVELGSLPTIEADPLQMRQLFQNLIGNALKFSQPNESPVVKVESQILHVNGESSDELARCEISVSDNGIGFEEVYLDRIFELFQRLHGRQEYEGTGMGLAICRKIVERHRGTITAKSAPGKGANFLVTLPLRQT